MNSKTPEKITGAGGSCSYSQEGVLPSPRTKRILDFDFFNIESPTTSKKTKLAEDEPGKVKIKDLILGQNSTDELRFRVTMLKHYLSDEGKRTVKFSGCDETGEIAFVGFHKVAERYAEALELNKCYTVRKFEVVEPNPKFPTHTGHQYSVQLDKDCVLEKVPAEGLPEMAFTMTPLLQIEDLQKKENVDVLGIITKNWGLDVLSSNKKRRFLSIADLTGRSTVSLWNLEAETIGDVEKVPVLLRRGMVDVLDGRKCITSSYYSTVWVNPEHDCSDLVEWWNFKTNEMQRNQEFQQK